MLRKTIPAVLAVLLLASLAFAGPTAAPAKDPHIDRLARVGRLWGTVRYLHPYLAYKDVDWDAALVAAIPKVRAAKSVDEYRAAVQGMLGALGDPVTQVADETPPASAPSEAGPLVQKLDEGVILLDLTSAGDLRKTFQELEAAAPDVNQVSDLVIDLRAGGDYAAMGYAEILLDEISGSLISRPCRAPSQRYLLHSGFQPHDGTSSGGYYSGFLTQFAASFQPRTMKPATRKRLVFLVDPRSLVPPLAVALQAVGDARFVVQGRLSEESLVIRRPVDLGEGLTAQVRVSEIVPMPGWSGVHADVEVPEGDAEGALKAAIAEARKEWPEAPPSASAAVQPLPDPVFHPDRGYPEMKDLSLEYRQLAVIRAWNVIHYFYPYLHLIGDWDAVLPEFLARMEEAKTGKDYALAIAEMATHVPDGHTNVWGHPALDERVGQVGLPVSLRWIEGAAVVIDASDEAKAAGLEPGVALISIDGEPVEAGIERLNKVFTASTPWSMRNRAIRLLLLGGEGSTAVLKLRKLDGSEREVSFVRDPKKIPPQPQGEIVRVLPGNIGYVDLPRLARGDVDTMFEKVKGTRGLILDMRGYPQGTAWAIAPRINTRNARIGAQFRRSQVSAFSFEEGEAGFYFSQPIPELPEGVEKYTAPTVMLIDDRAISQAEHSGLFYEEAAGTKFIGSPTAGANGDVTRFPLPGGIWMMFGGHDVRHADGRQLQRVGLVPDIEVEPTRKGIAAGKDEVLERAVRYLTEGK